MEDLFGPSYGGKVMLRVALADLKSWNPSRILAAELAPLAHGNLPLQPLEQLVEIVRERHAVPKGSKTLSASGIDVSGAWRSQTSFFESLGLPVNSMTGLRESDLVLYPGRPLIRITAEETGIAVVGNFMALRPKSEELSLWLWGLLNTTIGQAWLQRMSSINGSVVPRFSDTLGSTLVASVAAEDSTLLTQLRQLSTATQAKVKQVRESISGAQSWFRKTSISSQTDWTFLFTSEKDLSIFVGQPLISLIESIEVGKANVEIPATGEVSFPLVNHRTVSTGEYAETRTPTSFEVLNAGTLVVTSNGVRSIAAVTERDAILGKGVFGLHVISGVDPYWLRDFFNSETAQLQRKTLVKGVAIPFLTKSAVGAFMVPDSFESDLHVSQTLREACDAIFGC